MSRAVWYLHREKERQKNSGTDGEGRLRRLRFHPLLPQVQPSLALVLLHPHHVTVEREETEKQHKNLQNTKESDRSVTRRVKDYSPVQSQVLTDLTSFFFYYF